MNNNVGAERGGGGLSDPSFLPQTEKGEGGLFLTFSGASYFTCTY